MVERLKLNKFINGVLECFRLRRIRFEFNLENCFKVFVSFFRQRGKFRGEYKCHANFLLGVVREKCFRRLSLT